MNIEREIKKLKHQLCCLRNGAEEEFIAKITQFDGGEPDTLAPTFDIYKNTLSATLTTSYIDVGHYRITADADIFQSNKTIVNITNNVITVGTDLFIINWKIVSINQIDIFVSAFNSGFVDSVLSVLNNSIEDIRNEIQIKILH